jgi:uncharacterized membrane protein YbhN (UPF0104 family)
LVGTLSGPLVHHPLLFQAVLVAVLLAVAAFQIDFGTLASSFRDARYEYLLAVLAVTVMMRALHAVEWQITLTKVGRAPLLGLMGVLLIGTLVNMVVPASAGDVAKVQIAANRYNLPRAGLIGTRGAEAIVNAVIMVGFIGLAFALPGAGFGSPELLLGLAAASLVIFVGALIASRTLPEHLPDSRLLRRLPIGAGEQIRYHWPRLYAGFEAVRRPRLLIITIALNLVGWGLDILVIWLFGEAFHLSLPFVAYLTVAVAVAIVTVFPITFGNIGTYELLVTSVLTLYGVDASTALAFALGTHVFSTAYNLGLGFVAVWAMQLRPADVFRLAERAEQEPAARAGDRR